MGTCAHNEHVGLTDGNKILVTPKSLKHLNIIRWIFHHILSGDENNKIYNNRGK